MWTQKNFINWDETKYKYPSINSHREPGVYPWGLWTQGVGTKPSHTQQTKFRDATKTKTRVFFTGGGNWSSLSKPQKHKEKMYTRTPYPIDAANTKVYY